MIQKKRAATVSSSKYVVRTQQHRAEDREEGTSDDRAMAGTVRSGREDKENAVSKCVQEEDARTNSALCSSVVYRDVVTFPVFLT